MKCSTKEALVYPVVCGIVIFLSTISSTSGEGAIVPASTSLWASQMGHHPMGANPNHHNFVRFSPIFYSNKNPYNSNQQQQVVPGFNMVNNLQSSNSLKPDHMQQQFKRMPGAQANIQAYIGQPTGLPSPTAKTSTGQMQPYSRLIQGPTGIKSAALNGGKQPYKTLAQTLSAAHQQPYKRLPSPVTKTANAAQPFKRLAIPVKKPSSSFQLRIPGLPGTPHTVGTPSDTPSQPYKRLPGRGLNNIKKLNQNNPGYASVDKDDSDVIVVKSQDSRRKIYEQDVEVNSKLYKGFRVYPAVPLDHNEY